MKTYLDPNNKNKYVVLVSDHIGDNKILAHYRKNNKDDWHGEYYPNGYTDPETDIVWTNDYQGGYQEKLYDFDIIDVYRRVGPDHVFHIGGVTFTAKEIDHFDGL